MPETTKQAGAAVEHFPLMVPGARPAAERREVRSPYDGQLLATLDQADGAGTEQALETASGSEEIRIALFNGGREALAAGA